MSFLRQRDSDNDVFSKGSVGTELTSFSSSLSSSSVPNGTRCSSLSSSASTYSSTLSSINDSARKKAIDPDEDPSDEENDPSNQRTEDITRSKQILSCISSRQWDVAMKHARQCTAGVSTWGNVIVRGQPVRLLPIQLACTLNPPVELVDTLLEMDCDCADQTDRNGRLALHWACDANGSTRPVVQALLKANPSGAQVQEEQYGFLPLHIACFRPAERNTDATSSIGMNGNKDTTPSVDIVDSLLDSFQRGARIKDSMGWLPLHIACRTNVSGEQIVLSLLKAYPEASQVRDEGSRLPLHWACCHRHTNDGSGKAANAVGMVNALLGAYPGGATKREKNYGFLPLHIACSSGAFKGVVTKLLEVYSRGARKQDKNGSLPIHIACRANASDDIITELLAAFSEGAHFQDADSRLPLHWACHVCASENTISALLNAFEDGAQLTESKYGYLPLHVACKRGASEAVIAVLLASFPEAAQTRDDCGNLPIHIACSSHSYVTEGVIGMLVMAFPESLEREDQQGRTPLHLSETSSQPNRSAIKKLLRSTPLNWRDLSYPSGGFNRMNCVELETNSSQEQDLIAALKRNEEERKNNMLSSNEDLLIDVEPWEEPERNRNQSEFLQDDSQESSMCVLCLAEPVSYILYPCGHPCLCESCVHNHLASLNHVCPVGRCMFRDAVKVYGKIVDS